MKIKVTKRDISYGTRGSGEHCPVAYAVKREVSKFGAYSVIVSPLFAVIGFSTYFFPAEVTKWISNYDVRPSKAKPFEFILEVPQFDKYLK